MLPLGVAYALWAGITGLIIGWSACTTYSGLSFSFRTLIGPKPVDVTTTVPTALVTPSPISESIPRATATLNHAWTPQYLLLDDKPANKIVRVPVNALSLFSHDLDVLVRAAAVSLAQPPTDNSVLTPVATEVHSSRISTLETVIKVPVIQRHVQLSAVITVLAVISAFVGFCIATALVWFCASPKPRTAYTSAQHDETITIYDPRSRPSYINAVIPSPPANNVMLPGHSQDQSSFENALPLDVELTPGFLSPRARPMQVHSQEEATAISPSNSLSQDPTDLTSGQSKHEVGTLATDLAPDSMRSQIPPTPHAEPAGIDCAHNNDSTHKISHHASSKSSPDADQSSAIYASPAKSPTKRSLPRDATIPMWTGAGSRYQRPRPPRRRLQESHASTDTKSAVAAAASTAPELDLAQSTHQSTLVSTPAQVAPPPTSLDSGPFSTIHPGTLAAEQTTLADLPLAPTSPNVISQVAAIEDVTSESYSQDVVDTTAETNLDEDIHILTVTESDVAPLNQASASGSTHAYATDSSLALATPAVTICAPEVDSIVEHVSSDLAEQDCDEVDVKIDVPMRGLTIVSSEDTDWFTPTTESTALGVPPIGLAVHGQVAPESKDISSLLELPSPSASTAGSEGLSHTEMSLHDLLKDFARKIIKDNEGKERCEYPREEKGKGKDNRPPKADSHPEADSPLEADIPPETDKNAHTLPFHVSQEEWDAQPALLAEAAYLRDAPHKAESSSSPLSQTQVHPQPDEVAPLSTVETSAQQLEEGTPAFERDPDVQHVIYASLLSSNITPASPGQVEGVEGIRERTSEPSFTRVSSLPVFTRLEPQVVIGAADAPASQTYTQPQTQDSSTSDTLASDTVSREAEIILSPLCLQRVTSPLTPPSSPPLSSRAEVVPSSREHAEVTVAAVDVPALAIPLQLQASAPDTPPSSSEQEKDVANAPLDRSSSYPTPSPSQYASSIQEGPVAARQTDGGTLEPAAAQVSNAPESSAQGPPGPFDTQQPHAVETSTESVAQDDAQPVLDAHINGVALPPSTPTFPPALSEPRVPEMDVAMDIEGMGPQPGADKTYSQEQLDQQPATSADTTSADMDVDRDWSSTGADDYYEPVRLTQSPEPAMQVDEQSTVIPVMDVDENTTPAHAFAIAHPLFYTAQPPEMVGGYGFPPVLPAAPETAPFDDVEMEYTPTRPCSPVDTGDVRMASGSWSSMITPGPSSTLDSHFRNAPTPPLPPAPTLPPPPRAPTPYDNDFDDFDFDGNDVDGDDDDASQPPAGGAAVALPPSSTTRNLETSEALRAMLEIRPELEPPLDLDYGDEEDGYDEEYDFDEEDDFDPANAPPSFIDLPDTPEMQALSEIEWLAALLELQTQPDASDHVRELIAHNMDPDMPGMVEACLRERKKERERERQKAIAEMRAAEERARQQEFARAEMEQRREALAKQQKDRRQQAQMNLAFPGLRQSKAKPTNNAPGPTSVPARLLQNGIVNADITFPASPSPSPYSSPSAPTISTRPPIQRVEGYGHGPAPKLPTAAPSAPFPPALPRVPLPPQPSGDEVASMRVVKKYALWYYRATFEERAAITEFVREEGGDVAVKLMMKAIGEVQKEEAATAKVEAAAAVVPGTTILPSGVAPPPNLVPYPTAAYAQERGLEGIIDFYAAWLELQGNDVALRYYVQQWILEMKSGDVVADVRALEAGWRKKRAELADSRIQVPLTRVRRELLKVSQEEKARRAREVERRRREDAEKKEKEAKEKLAEEQQRKAAVEKWEAEQRAAGEAKWRELQEANRKAGKSLPKSRLDRSSPSSSTTAMPSEPPLHSNSNAQNPDLNASAWGVSERQVEDIMEARRLETLAFLEAQRATQGQAPRVLHTNDGQKKDERLDADSADMEL